MLRFAPAAPLVAVLLALAAPAAPALADIPATRVMTLYRFNGPASIPFHDINTLRREGATRPAGALAQGSSVIPCVVVENGQPLTDKSGTPYVGFKVVVDAAQATPGSAARLQAARQSRQHLRVSNHHCPAGTRYVLDVRNLYDLKRPPFFEPNPASSRPRPSRPTGTADQIVRTFHNSSYCSAVNNRLMGRRDALREAWSRFAQTEGARWGQDALTRARHLDYTMRTAIFEGHLGRGCSAYGACERNIIALSIRNRARESCLKHHGCEGYGDFTSVSSAVSQYNIWDEYIAQTSGLTACFLRDEGGAGADYRLYRDLYEQSVSDVERILFGSDSDLQEIFPGTSLAGLKGLKHYYHAPAMGKCFPQFDRIEYLSGAIARRGNDFALLADTRVQVGEKTESGYFFKSFAVRAGNRQDTGSTVDEYPGFVLDPRKVSLKKPTRCAPYGIPRGCGFQSVGRYRKTPTWLNEGSPIEVKCRVRARGERCQNPPTLQSARVGGTCDVEMRPFTGIR